MEGTATTGTVKAVAVSRAGDQQARKKMSRARLVSGRAGGVTKTN